MSTLSRPRLRMVVALAISLLAPGGCWSSAFAQPNQFAIVVNSQNSVSNVPLKELRKIFLGERRFWPGSVPIKLLVRSAGSREHGAMLKLLGMTENEYKQYWTQQVFRGEAQTEPTILASNEMQVSAVARSIGAIALMNIHDVKPAMKIVTINDQRPGQPGYPLHD